MDEYPEIDWSGIAEYERQHALKNMKWCNATWEIKDDYKWLMRRFYWFKTWVCLKLNRHGASCQFPVFTYDEYSCPDSVSWACVWVEPGIFKGWKITIGSDGT